MPEPTPTNMTAPEHQGPAALLARLISIDSANPDLGPSAGEAVIADFAGEWLTARGFEVHRLEQRRGRLSIVAVAHGSGGGRSLISTATSTPSASAVSTATRSRRRSARGGCLGVAPST